MLKRGYSLKGNKREIMENHTKGSKPVTSRFSRGTFDNLDSDREEVVPNQGNLLEVKKEQNRQNGNELFTANSRMYSRQVVLTKRDSFKEKKRPWYYFGCNCQRSTKEEKRQMAQLKKLKTSDTDDDDSRVQESKEELDFLRMKNQSLALSVILEIYMVAIVITEVNRLMHEEAHENCNSVYFYTFSLLKHPDATNAVPYTLLWLRVVILILHFMFVVTQLIKPKLQKRLTRLIPFISIMVWVVFSHLQLEINIVQSQIFMLGEFVIMPLVLIGQCQAAVAQRFNNVISISILQLLSHGFPVYMSSKLSKQQYLECGTPELKPFFLDIILPGVFIHFIGFVLILSLVQRLVDTLSQERINAEIVRGEYNKILEKMPEGILILSREGEIKFMNMELRDVLNLQYADKDEDKQGLELKMFKKYNLVEELSSPQEEEEQEHSSESLNNLIECEDWKVDEDRFYELDIFGFQPEKDEDRIFTQIRKAKVEYHEQEATLLLIRNITHIINYEKAKNVGKYQEMLTGTMSHEMLTPLNTIINLSQFIELKISQLLMNNQHTKEEQLKIINLTKQQLQLQGHSTFKDQRTEREEEFESCSESGNSPHTHTSKNDMKIPEFLLSQQRMMIMQGADEQEGLMTSAFEYQQMVKSSAIILQYLVKELIDLNNIKQNKFTPNFQGHDQQSLMESCQEIIDCYKVQAREKNIFLRLCRTSKVFLRDFEIYFDKQRYQQILINLVQNAVKFTSVGGVEIVAEIDQHNYQPQKQQQQQHNSISQFSNSHLPYQSQQENIPEISCIMSGSMKMHLRGEDCAAGSNGGQCDNCGFIITRVKDSGVGMKKEVVDKLFQLFALVQSNQTKKGLITTQGIGLGLSVNKQVIEKLGGKIKINTTPGQGTEVLFTIPYKCRNCAFQDAHHIPSLMAQNTMMMTMNTQQILNRKMTTRRNNDTQNEFSFAGEKKSELHSQRSLKSVTKGIVAALAIKSKSKQPFGGDFQSIYGSYQQSKSCAQEESQSKQTLGGDLGRKIGGLESDNLGYDSPYGPINGPNSLQFPSNLGKSEKNNNNSESFGDTEHSLNFKKGQLLQKKKTFANPKNQRLSPNQGHFHLTSPKQNMVQSAVQQNLKYSNVHQGLFSGVNGTTIRHQIGGRDSTIKETINSFGQQSAQIHAPDRDNILPLLPNRKLTDRYQASEKSALSLYNRAAQHSKPKSMRATEMEIASDIHKYKSRGRSVTGLSIHIMQHLVPENHNSSGIVYLSANDEVNHQTRELMQLNLNDYLLHGRSNYLRNLCKALDTSPNDEAPSPERFTHLLQVPNKDAFHSMSDIKLNLNQQTIKLGEKPIIEGEDSSEMPMSPGFRDTSNSFVKDRLCSAGPSSIKNNHATNSGVGALSLNYPNGSIQPGQQYQSNRSELEMFSNAQLMFKKDSSKIKKIKGYDDGLDEEGKFHFSKIVEESDQERSHVQSKELISNQGYDLNLQIEPNQMINQGPIQHQNESFGHSVHTQSQYHQKGGGLNQQVDQSRHNTNSRMESSMARPDSLVQSIRQSRREKQQLIKKSRQTSNGASKRGTDAGVLNLQSSVEETSANVPRVMPLVYNPEDKSKQQAQYQHRTVHQAEARCRRGYEL
ncbi:hypothetical protein FGO68_gene5960 [Halteria grandinella]|uniref:histidine kinase n=1 Tax=Halteria grandinella TaxID=5974 RepID=A0A8J8P5Q3_HALGN|nr:hypothetical protein FGO68_gene5960 [Halteria grandinella]